MTKTIIASLARIADFADVPYELGKIDKSEWATADYVIGAVTGKPSEIYKIENCSGDMVPVQAGDRVIGRSVSEPRRWKALVAGGTSQTVKCTR